jgi:cytochrome d ubiquinol oxidase subunit II
MPEVGLVEVAALLALAGVGAYAVLAGADFGGGIWDLLARGERAGAQRAAIAAAMGPVWEANHVWLIFVIVLLFTAFPAAFAVLSVGLFWPFHLALVGIVLRGAAFVLRAHGRAEPRGAGRVVMPGWGQVFGAASAVTPLLLGACLGAVSTGRLRAPGGRVAAGAEWAWLDVFPLATGAVALAVCAYLAAVYLTLETAGELREQFRRRALWAWLAGGVLSVATLLLAYAEAPRLWEGLTSPRAGPVVAAGIALAPLSGLAVWRRRFGMARVCAAGQVVLLLAGWALAQWPFVVYPDVELGQSAAPAATLRALLWTVPFGMAVLLPSLWLLFRVFKGRNPAEDTARVRE